jgi:5'-deoxynucleotidase YfbR-like HD superfamily hydrolase
MSIAKRFIHDWSKSPLPSMSDVYRFSSLPVHNLESVAEHSFYVAALSYVFGLEMEIVLGEEINREVLLTRCIFHDIDESLTGDIIRPFKHSSDHVAATLAAAAMEAVDATYRKLSGGNAVACAWENAKDNTVEGHILGFADVWSVQLYLAKEFKLGNRYARAKLVLLVQRIEGWKWPDYIQPYAEALVDIIRDDLSRSFPG